MDDLASLSEVDILPKLPPQFNEWLESKKWTERRDALQALVGEMTKTPKLDPKANYGELTNNLRNVLAKDANINVCALAAKSIGGLAIGLGPKFAPHATMYVPVIFERFKEKKPVLRDPLIECIDAVAATVNLDTLVDELVAAIDKPNPNIKLQGCHFIYRVMKKYSQGSAPKKLIKGIAPIMVKFAADSDAEVRDGACGAIGSMMRLTGDKVMNSFIGAIQDDKTKMKRIMDARDQAAAEVAEEDAKRSEIASALNGSAAAVSSRSDASSPNAAPTPEVDPWEMLDPVDVLSKLPPTFNEGVESKKWQERRDALQSLLALCIENPRLCPKANYGEHVAILKKILEKDANINVCAVAARCLTALATGLRKKFAIHASLVTPTIFEKFKEKKPVLRDPLMDCIDAVAASTTLESMAEDIQVALEKPNPNIKIQTNLFLYRLFKTFNAQTMPKKVLKALAPIIVKHTGDSDPEVRDASYAALGAAMKAIGEKACLTLVADIAEDKTKMTKIKDFCAKAIQEAGPDVVSAMVQSIHKSNPDGPKTSETTSEKMANGPLKPPASGGAGKGASSKLIMEETNGQDEKQEAQPKETSPAKVEETPKPRDEVLLTNKEKAVRLRDEKNLKLLKWNFEQPTTEHVEQLRIQFANVCQVVLCGMLFNKDFKQHLKAIEVLSSLAVENPDALVANSDLVLKWISLRFFETNPTVLLKALDLASTVFALIQEKSEPFSDIELNSFAPYLILKTGEAKDSVRTPVRNILQLLTEIVGPTKIFPLLLDGLKTKNSRQRTECLQVLEQILDTNGIAATTAPGPALKAIASCIGDRDNNVRSAAINAVVVAWKEEGDRVFQLIGKMADKDKAMLDERIKRSGVVPKARGGPEKVLNTPAQRDRPQIRTAVKGRAMGSAARSSSRPGSRPSSRPPSRGCEEYEGQIDDASQNRTFTVEPDDMTMKRKSRKGRFALDLAALGLDDQQPAQFDLPNEAEELTRMLEPIEPVVYRRPPTMQMTRRTESVSSITSLESSAGDVDKVVHGVASISPTAANQAISQLHFLFNDQTMFRFIADRVDAVVQGIVTQSSLIRSRHLNDVSALNDTNELLRTICHFLSSLSKETTTCSRISSDALKMLIQEFLYLLKDERMKQLKDVSSIYRSLNFLSIRLCDNSDPTACFLALTSMLSSALYDPRNDTLELIMKCIYKQSEQLLREVPLDIRAIIRAIHGFMHEFCSRAEGNPSVKSAVHTMEICIQRLVAGARSSVLDYISGIPENSEAVIYMRKCVRGLQNRSNQSSLASSAYGELPGQVPSSNYEETLRGMVSKISDDLLGKGIRSLANYLKANPEARKYLDDILKQERSKDFILYHLKKMESSDIETPQILPETAKTFAFINEMKSNLKKYYETGNWPGSEQVHIDRPVAVAVEEKLLRRSIQSARAGSEGAPENEPTRATPHKRNLTPSDVEPLKQRLLNMRKMQAE